MTLRVNPESRFLDVDPEPTYSRVAVLGMRFPCPDCGVQVTPTPVNVGSNANSERYAPGRRWRCFNGHGSPDSL